MITITNLQHGPVRDETVGHGPISVVCLHGNSSSSDSFRKLATLLEENFTFYLLDFPGHGGSGRGKDFFSSYSFSGLKSILIDWLEVRGIRPDGIIGHSMGGHIAAQAASNIPSLKFLVLLSSPPIAGSEGVSRFFLPTAPMDAIFEEHLSYEQARGLARAFTHPTTDPFRLAAIEGWIRGADGTFRRELGRSLLGAEVTDEVEALARVPHVQMLLIGGQDDQFIRSDYFDWVTRRMALPNQCVLLVPNVGHCPHIEAPEVTAHAIAERFISRGSKG